MATHATSVAASGMSAAPTQHSSGSVDTPAPLPRTRLTLHTSSIVKSGATYSTDLRSRVLLSSIVRPYSHVDLVSAKFEVMLNPDSDGLHVVAVHARDATVPGSITEFLALDTVVCEYAQPNLPLTLSCGLPPGHAFGTELKQTVLANAPPSFTYSHAGCTVAANTTIGYQRITIVVDCHGRAPNVGI